MSNQEVKPREFWINEGYNGLDLGWYTREVAEFPEAGSTEEKNVIHVIEKSAYLKAVAALKIVQENKDGWQKKCEVLHQYNLSLREQLEQYRTGDLPTWKSEHDDIKAVCDSMDIRNQELTDALKKIAKGCPTGIKGCKCLENIAQIALGEKMDLDKGGIVFNLETCPHCGSDKISVSEHGTHRCHKCETAWVIEGGTDA